MKPGNKNSYNSLKTININNSEYKYFSLSEAEKNGLDGVSKLPKSLKVLLENLLRYEDDLSVTRNQIEAIKNWLKTKKSSTEIAYRPARVLLQDYTGIPAVADLAAMRELLVKKIKIRTLLIHCQQLILLLITLFKLISQQILTRLKKT